MPERSRRKPSQTSRITVVDRMYAWLLIHRDTFHASLARLKSTPVASFMTIVVIAITLSLPASFYVLVKNVQQLGDALGTGSRISLYLKQELADADGSRVAEQLQQLAAVNKALVIGKTAALEEFKTYSGFGEALDALESNPLPVVIQVDPIEQLQPAELAQLLEQLAALPESDFAQLDMEWVERLHSMIEIVERVVTLLSLLLAVAVLFIVGNTIRLELHSRRDEVIVTKLVGGTDAFIRRPFLYSGFWYGSLGALVAWAIVTTTLLILEGAVGRLSALYESRFELLYLNLEESVMMLSVAALLGVAGAWLVLSSHLYRLNPE
jgi:cell division transport system permease protein